MSENPDEYGELSFGDYNLDHIEDGHEVVWHPVVNKLFWSLTLNDIWVNGTKLNICENHGDCLITPDTGTSLMTMPHWGKQIFN